LKLNRIETETGATVEFTFDGRMVTARDGDTIAAALLASGQTSIRNTQVSGAARAPYCMMGACYDCLVDIDGTIVQACMTPVQHGLQVQTCHQSDSGE
jgi:predicted molibdopterin-dependent oxidoreductase YjgC